MTATNTKTEEAALKAEAKAEKAEAKAEAKEPKEVTGKALDVQTRGGGFVRTYSKEQHGANFQKFAEEFAKKIGGKVVKH
jgi:hypothetical protein